MSVVSNGKNVSIENFDVLKLYLRQELGRVQDSLSRSLRPKDFPKNMEVSNLKTLLDSLNLILKAIESIEINPQINVKVPEIRVPEARVKVEIPDIVVPRPEVRVDAPNVTVKPADVIINLSALIEAMSPLKYLSDSPSSPLSVRLSDGKRFIEALKQVEKGQKQMTAVFSGARDVTIDNGLNNPVNVKSKKDGTWGYHAGTSGTLTMTGTKKVTKITAIALEAGGTIVINGGDTITIPYGAADQVSSELTLEPDGNVISPEIVFTGTDAYVVEYVT